MAERPDRTVQLRFRIGAYTPKTMPMARLARYLSNLATVLGHSQGVHFARIEAGSMVVGVGVEQTVYAPVLKRLERVRNGVGPSSALHAHKALAADLAVDGAEFGDVIAESGARLLRIVPSATTSEQRYGPVSEKTSLDGVVTLIGGARTTGPVPVHLCDHDRVHKCSASQDIATRLSQHFRGKVLRVTGEGKWLRDPAGRWVMKSFVIDGFTVPRQETVAEATERLRAIDGGWKRHPDLLGALEAIRRGDD